MKFRADLHVHSRFSRATARDSNLYGFSCWARRKGLDVLATGDFTHPAWREEIRNALVPAEPGLFKLNDALEAAVSSRLPQSCRTTPTRFLLSVEISNIYKKTGCVRKVHNLIFVPDFEKAEKLVAALDKIGNLNSDGRPILGLDSRNLLEMTLACGDDCFLVPAHIWTPWFSALGSKSGFDSIDECYGDLAEHVFAAETGLSSDPPMNWRVSSLDRFALISNSDAHSPSKLGREACVFDTDMSYFAIRNALKTRVGYGGTIEFFPEEGKYHADGHRKCQTSLSPAETRQNKGLCPVCGKPLTIGVLNRVEELADRPDGVRPPNAAPFKSMIPLPEILSEVIGAGPASQKVEKVYNSMLIRLGPELHILEDAPIADIAAASSGRIAQGIDKMRRGEVVREPGYDGEYGIIRVFPGTK